MRRPAWPRFCKGRRLLSTLLDVPIPMPPFEPSAAPAQSPRTIRLMRAPGADGVGILCIAKDRRSNYYVFQEIRCDIGGRGFAVHRLGLGNVYHVRVGRPHECACDCLGCLRHGHCKHILGLSALIGHGLL
jgi:hypothetical protein